MTPDMTEVKVHLNNDGLGGACWWAESDGFIAVAEGIDELLDFIREWADDEGIGDYEMTLVRDTLTGEGTTALTAV